MNEVMAIIELWIKSSKSIQEIDTKVSLIEKGLFQIKQEAKNMKGGDKQCTLTHLWQEYLRQSE